jgi:putative SOS response-associated peptidase YedK
MCGRYVRSSPTERFADLFGARTGLTLKPSYNVAPSQPILVARNAEQGGRELAALHWGLIPHWSKEPQTAYSTINARAETVAVKPAFRLAFQRRRCLIAADAYYEWKALAHGKQPYAIQMQDGEPFAFAGIWECWSRGEQRVESCAIIVTVANELTQAIHDRMPVILAPEDYAVWMDPTLTDKQGLLELLKPCPSARMRTFSVSKRVNNPRYDTPELLLPESPDVTD